MPLKRVRDVSCFLGGEITFPDINHFHKLIVVPSKKSSHTKQRQKSMPRPPERCQSRTRTDHPTLLPQRTWDLHLTLIHPRHLQLPWRLCVTCPPSRRCCGDTGAQWAGGCSLWASSNGLKIPSSSYIIFSFTTLHPITNIRHYQRL